MSEDRRARGDEPEAAGSAAADESRVPELLQHAFDVFSRASEQLEQSYNELKIKADRLAKDLAATNEELQRQLAEKERISSFLNNILDSITNGIIVVGSGGEVALSNRFAEKMLGLSGAPEGHVYSSVLGPGPVTDFLDECLRPDYDGPRTREVTVSEGEGRRHLALSFAPVLDSAGSQAGSLLVVQDITRLKLLEEQALRTERLAAMGEMAAELAHEIRNPLGSIEIFASLLNRDIKEEANRTLAENIIVGVKSLNAVVTNMLTFTRRVEINPEALDISELIRDAFAFMERVLAAQGIELALELDGPGEKVLVDPERFKQVLLNLAQNSISAMEGGGKLRVSSNSQFSEDGEQSAVVRVSDTGCGIAPEHLQRIFDPFFSLSKSGTGLGLSVASQIVGEHGGVISAESTPGKGTTMTITLPIRRASRP